MSKPFQFSMRQMFCAMFWFSLTACALELGSEAHSKNSSVLALQGFLLYFAVFACTGAGIGAFFGRQFLGAWWGTGFSILLLVVMVIVGIIHRL